MRPFVYLTPSTVEEAIRMRIEHAGASVVLNGGTDIVIQLRDRLISPEYVIDIKKIPDLHKLTFDKSSGLFIGSCTTMNVLANDPNVIANYPYLAKAAGSVGSKQVRNRATCIGNIVNASPLADTATPLLANDATIVMQGEKGVREVPLREFFIFVRKTVLQPDEIVLGIKVPYLEGAKGEFSKISRRKEVDLSTICGTVLQYNGEFRLAFGAVAPTPVRLPKTEALLSGKKITPELIDEACELAKSEVSPIDDIRASKQYRLDVVGVVVKRSLEALGKEA